MLGFPKKKRVGFFYMRTRQVVFFPIVDMLLGHLSTHNITRLIIRSRAYVSFAVHTSCKYIDYKKFNQQKVSLEHHLSLPPTLKGFLKKEKEKRKPTRYFFSRASPQSQTPTQSHYRNNSLLPLDNQESVCLSSLSFFSGTNSLRAIYCSHL